MSATIASAYRRIEDIEEVRRNRYYVHKVVYIVFVLVMNVFGLLSAIFITDPDTSLIVGAVSLVVSVIVSNYFQNQNAHYNRPSEFLEHAKMRLHIIGPVYRSAMIYGTLEMRETLQRYVDAMENSITLENSLLIAAVRPRVQQHRNVTYG